MNTIYLLGFMGTGKSWYGTRLAKSLGGQFIDLDQFIEEREGDSIASLFKNKGEDYFREIESKYLREATASNAVIALGGGTPCFYDNMDFIKKSGISVYLKTDESTLYERLKVVKHHRPLISSLSDEELKEYIHSKLKEREKYYLKADIITDTKEADVEQLKNLITQHTPPRSSQG